MASADTTNAQLKAISWRIKLSTDAATELVTGQVINSIEEIKTLTKYCVTLLCSIIHKPGGGTDRHVVSETAENLFHILVYYCQYKDRITQDTDHFLVTLVNLRALFGQCELEKYWDLMITEYVKPVF